MPAPVVRSSKSSERRLALYCCVGIVLIGGDIELRQGAFKIVPDNEYIPLSENLKDPSALPGCRELIEHRPFQVGAQHLHHTICTCKLLEAYEACAIAKEAAPCPPVGGFGRKGSLSHAAHCMQYDAPMRAEQALHVVEFAGPAVEAVLRRRREGAGFVPLHGRASKTATAAGVLCIRASDKLGEPRGILGIQFRNGKIHPEQFI